MYIFLRWNQNNFSRIRKRKHTAEFTSVHPTHTPLLPAFKSPRWREKSPQIQAAVWPALWYPCSTASFSTQLGQLDPRVNGEAWHLGQTDNSLQWDFESFQAGFDSPCLHFRSCFCLVLKEWPSLHAPILRTASVLQFISKKYLEHNICHSCCFPSKKT